MKTVAIIECRMGSTRLPGKVLMKFGHHTVMGYMVDRIKHSVQIDEIVVATTISPRDDAIVNFCRENFISYFRGSEENVIRRVASAGQAHGADIIISLTGDCPFVCPKMIDKLVLLLKENNYDYVSNDVIERFYPDGLDIQVCKASILGKTIPLITNPQHLSHSAWNIPTYCGKTAKILHWSGDPKYCMPDIGLTLDTSEDYVLLKKIYEKFDDSDRPFDIYKVLDYIIENPGFMTNRHIKRNIPGNG